jgi:hypothetical protein
LACKKVLQIIKNQPQAMYGDNDANQKERIEFTGSLLKKCIQRRLIFATLEFCEVAVYLLDLCRCQMRMNDARPFSQVLYNVLFIRLEEERERVKAAAAAESAWERLLVMRTAQRPVKFHFLHHNTVSHVKGDFLDHESCRVVTNTIFLDCISTHNPRRKLKCNPQSIFLD